VSDEHTDTPPQGPQPEEQEAADMNQLLREAMATPRLERWADEQVAEIRAALPEERSSTRSSPRSRRSISSGLTRSPMSRSCSTGTRSAGTGNGRPAPLCRERSAAIDQAAGADAGEDGQWSAWRARVENSG
jgi:hypothetical protein